MNSPPFLTPKIREQTDRAAPGRTCLLVLGMHRSGTSALARVLSLAGAKLPVSLMGASAGNETGHWESKALANYHDRLLNQLGSDWHDWRALEIGRLPLERRRDIKAEIGDLLAAEFGDAPLFVVKDPRICRFAPLFLEALEGAGIGPRIVHILRNPLEVAESLGRRDDLQRTDAVLQWLRHALDSEAATRSRNRVFVSYAALLKDWRTTLESLTEALQVAWPYSAAEISGQVASFLDEELRHHAHTPEDVLLDPAIRDWVGEAYAALLVLEQNPASEAAQRRLDAIRREFNHAGPVLDKLQAEARAAWDRQSAELEAETGQLKAALADQETETGQLKAALADRDTKTGQLKAALADRDTKTGQLKDEFTQAGKELERLTAALAAREQDIADLNAARREAESGAARLTAVLEERDTKTVELKQGLAAAEQRNADLATLAQSRSDQITALEHEKASMLRAEQRSREELIAHFHSSLSWRVTIPLRVIADFSSAIPRASKRFIRRAARGLLHSLPIAEMHKSRLRLYAYRHFADLFPNAAIDEIHIQRTNLRPQLRLLTSAQSQGSTSGNPDPVAALLNSPAPADRGADVLNPISRLMHFLWHARPDLQNLCDINTEQGRAQLAQWYLLHASNEYGLGPSAYPGYVLNGLLSAADPYVRARAQSLISGAPPCSQTPIDESADPISRPGFVEEIGTSRLAAERPNQGIGEKTGLPGATLVGYARGEFGMGQQVRTVAMACSEAEIPFSVWDFEEPGLHGNQDKCIDHWLTNSADHVCNIFNINADVLPAAYFQLKADLGAGRYNIGYWAWELPQAPQEFDLAFMMVDEVWAISRFVQESLAERSPVPVMHMPLPVNLPRLARTYTKKEFGLPEDCFVFLFSFDAASYLERKNPLAAVRAFKKAFGKNNARVRLVLKTMNVPTRDARWSRLLAEIDGDRRIVVMQRRLAREDAVGLASVCDAFVSLHRSEGFGFCIAEVMALGKPAISTNFSGSIEFADESTACVVDCTMIPVEAGSYPFGAGQVWADPSIEQASWYMRKLVEDDAFRQQIATAGQRKILDCFSSAAIGRRYAARLSQLGILPVHDDAGSTARASGASEATLKKRSAATAQVFHLDQPSVSGGGKVVLSGAVEVTGWAISAHGIHRIGVRCGDRDLGRAHYGIMRPDVGEIHSEFPDSSRSGFSLMFDSRKLPDGPATLELVITDKGQAEHSKSIAVQIDNSHGPYEQWEKGNRRSAAELGKFAAKQNALGYKPLISLVVSVDGDENGHSTLATLRSIAEQIYPNWELIVRADRSMAVKLLEGVSQIDQMNQVRIVDPASSSLEGMLAGCRGDYIGIVGPGDRLDSLALFAITETLNADRNLELVYSDEVQSGAGAPRPLFKPAWSPILLKSTNYIGHLWVAKAAVLQRVAAKHDWDSATDDEHGLLLRVAAETSSVAHVPMVLCSRSEESGERTRSTRVMAAARKASNRERASVSRAPLVSIVIPTCLRDSTVTKRCFTSLLAKTSYPAIEVVVVTNNLEDAQEADDFLKIWPFMKLPYEGPFNWSAINNMGARQAQGEYLLFLNDDVEATYEDWLDRMMSCASQTGADIVGPILRYPNGSIQHGGMFLTDDGAPGRHLFRFCKGDEDEARNLLEFDREVSAVTGACMLVSRKAFDELGGFDETLPIICNDVDFCLRAAQRRYDCVLAAGVELIHHEGISRAGIHEVEDVKRFLSHWDWLLKEGDPYYNPNLSVESSSWLVDPEARGRLAGRKNSLRSNRQAQTGLPRTMGRSIPARHSG